MSDFPTYAGALRTRLEAFTALPIFWPNSKTDPDGTTAPNGFVTAEIRIQDEAQTTLGPAGTGMQTRRDYAELAIYLYVPRGTLVGAAEAHAKTIRDLFTTGAVAGVTITKKRIGTGQGLDTPQGRYWGLPVVIEFWSDRTE